MLPFPQYELQARWVARVLSGRVGLPSREAMQVTTRPAAKAGQDLNV